MSQKDVQDYLDKGMYGAPQIKPDELKKYLGTFRERVIFSMTYEEAKNTVHDNFCLERFDKYLNGTLSIDANSPLEMQNHYMLLAKKKNINFKLVDSDVETLSPSDITVVFSVDFAINLENISVQQFIKEDRNDAISSTSKEIPKKESFFKRLFK